MSDFSDRPFVAGSLIGVRAFDVDTLGRLVGPSYRTVFTPGENEATCGGTTSTGQMVASLQRQMHVFSSSLDMRVLSGATSTVPPAKKAEKPRHVVGGVGCSCGFYAYFDGKSDYSRPGNVTALIEGYGVCTVGTRGFRAEKARLVALVDARNVASKHHDAWDRWADWNYAHDVINTTLFVAPALGALYGAVFTIVAAVQVSLWCLLAIAVPAALGALSLASARGWSHGLDRRYRSVHPELSCTDDAGSASLDLVRRNYPDVPVYPSLKAAMRAHPLTVPEPPLQPSPEDEDFWTRSAS